MGKFFKTSKSENRTITTKKGRFMSIFNRIASRQRNSREITPPLIDNQLSPIMETDAEETRHSPSEPPQNTTPNIKSWASRGPRNDRYGLGARKTQKTTKRNTK